MKTIKYGSRAYARDRALATLAILLATAIWGMTFAFVKDAVAYMSPFNFLFWRFGIASILLFLLFHQQIRLHNKKTLLQGLIVGLFIAGTVIFQTIGLRYTDASTASFITSLSVIMVTLMMCAYERKWPTWNVVIAVILATYGVWLITFGHKFEFNVGDVWIFLCAICFAFYIIFVGEFSKSGNTFTLTLVQLLTIFILAGFSTVVSQTFSVPDRWNTWLAILFCAVFASVTAFSLQMKYQKFLTPTKTAIIFSTEPIFATISAAVYLKEKLSMQFFFGATLIFAAIVLSELLLKKKVIPQD